MLKRDSTYLPEKTSAIYDSGEYLQHNPDWHVQDSPWKARQILKMLNRHQAQPRTIAEVGCGAGEILNQLHSYLGDETQCYGYDISHQAYERARTREKPGLTFYLEDFTEQEGRFDLLLVIDVFEHVEDYMGFLRRLRSKATHFIFHIPLDLSAQTVIREHSLLQTRKEVGHLHYFTEGTALATLRDTGYTVEDYFFTARSIALQGGGMKRKIARLPRKLLAMVSKSLASRILGGFSLMVWARAAED